MSHRLLSFGVVFIAFALAATVAVAAQQDTPEPVRVDPPDWRFVVYQVQDPYVGTVAFPAEPAPNTRYISAEVAVINGSDLPLAVSPGSFRLRDSVGREYLGGSAIGAETRLNARTLAAGERAQGWIWFVVPDDAEITQLVFFGAPPEFRVSWSDAPIVEATPVSDEASPVAD